MKTKLLTTASLLALSLSFNASAAVDTIDSTDGQANTYFVPNDSLKTSDPYYREYGEDWGWTHNAIAGPFTSASLNISAYDVDANATCCGGPEVDEIYGLNDGVWELIGTLEGSSNTWSYTSFNLGNEWFAEIEAGLQVMMMIDVLTQDSWIVTLAKSVLETDGGTLPPPTPGVNEVPIPAAAFLFGPALLGFFGLRRKSKTAA